MSYEMEIKVGKLRCCRVTFGRDCKVAAVGENERAFGGTIRRTSLELDRVISRQAIDDASG